MKNKYAKDRKFVASVLTNQVRDLLFQAREDELSQYDLTTPQAILLDVIDRVGGRATASDLARRQLRRPHSISSVLARMEKRGLVSRSTKPEKKGKIYFSLTEEGKKSLEQSMKNESIHEILSCLSEEEVEDLIAKLARVREHASNRMTDAKKMLFPL